MNNFVLMLASGLSFLNRGLVESLCRDDNHEIPEKRYI